MTEPSEQGTRWDRWAPYYDQDTAGQDVRAAVTGLAGLAGEGPALELGIGTGKLAIPLADRCVPVFGMDASPEMIRRLEERAVEAAPRSPVRAVTGDMAAFDLGEVFPLIYMSVSTIFLLTSQEDQVGCFRSAARHLRTDGRFVIEAAVPHASGMAVQREQMIVREMSDDHLKWSAFLHDSVNQTIRAQEVRIGPEGVRMLPNVMRYAFPSELDLMARLAGLVLERRTADWSGRPFTPSSTHHVSVYTRPADPTVATGVPA
ncbi:class I SAM-dependent DNA methyltransferase [Streptomyces cyaneofuscatus]